MSWYDEVPKKLQQRGSGFAFSKRSLKNLNGVHRDLVSVVCRALQLTKVDFVVIEGLRTRERQAELVRTGASQTMNSRHLTGHAIDVVPWIDGTVRWDWPPFYDIAAAMKQAAKELNIPITWGGDWTAFKDGPHFQLDWKHYPA